MLTVCSTASAQTKERAVLFSGTELDDSYLLTEKVSVVFNKEGEACICLDGVEKTEFALGETNTLTAEFKNAFKLKANQDPDHPDRYYSTFYTGKGAYKVPEAAKAYTGTIEDGEEDGIGILALSAVESVIPCGEAVVVRGSQKDIMLMPSCKDLTPLAGNILEGTDAATTLGTGQYALSLGQHGVGFYLWDGKTIGANKAYLTLDEALGVKALQFRFNDEPGPTGIKAPSSSSKGESSATYDLKGMLVNDGYRGIVIKNGKKTLNK